MKATENHTPEKKEEKEARTCQSMHEAPMVFMHSQHPMYVGNTYGFFSTHFSGYSYSKQEVRRTLK